jgi:hypothetical protein
MTLHLHQRVDSVRTWKPQIEKHDVYILVINEPVRFFGRGCGQGAKTPPLGHFTACLAQRPLIVDHEKVQEICSLG